MLKYIEYLLIVCLVFGVLSACNIPILHDIDEGEANHVLDTLQQNNIEGKKIRVTQGSQVSYTIEIPKGDAPLAWHVLRENNLPRPHKHGFTEVFGNIGLVPTATQEQALMRHALAGEISRTLQSIEGVREAHVHVVLPKQDPFAAQNEEPPKSPKAAVLLRVGSKFPITEQEVQKVVAGSIDGLKPTDVNVVFKTIDANNDGKAPPALVKVGPFYVAPRSRVPLLLTLITTVLMIVGLALAILLVVRRNRIKSIQQLPQTTITHSQIKNLDSSLSLLGQSLQQSKSFVSPRKNEQPRQE